MASEAVANVSKDTLVVYPATLAEDEGVNAPLWCSTGGDKSGTDTGGEVDGESGVDVCLSADRIGLGDIGLDIVDVGRGVVDYGLNSQAVSACAAKQGQRRRCGIYHQPSPSTPFFLIAHIFSSCRSKSLFT